MEPVRRSRAKHLAQPRFGIVRSARQQTTDGHPRPRTATLVSAHAIKAPATLTIGALAAMAAIGLAALSAVLTVVAAHGTCSDTGVEAAPSGAAKRAVPANYLSLYRSPPAAPASPGPCSPRSARSRPTTVARAPPACARASTATAAAPARCSSTSRDGPPSTWATYAHRRQPRRHQRQLRPGRRDPVRRPLPKRAPARGPRATWPGDLRLQPLAGLRRDVLARARAYARAGDEQLATPSGEPRRGGMHRQRPRRAGRPGEPRAPSGSLARAPTARCPRGRWPAAGRPSAIDARLYGDAVWVLRRYQLRVTAAREAGHHTHGDGTALDLVPAEGDGPGRLGRAAPARSPATSAGPRPARARAAAPPARSTPPSKASATTATPATAHRAPAAAPASRTCTSPGPPPATAPAASPRPANG